MDLQNNPIQKIDWASEFAPELRTFAEKQTLSGVKIDPASVIGVAKKTKYELDQICLDLSPSELIRQYEKEGIDPDVIIRSHENQLAAKAVLETVLGKDRVVSRDDFLKMNLEGIPVVIAIGGDNHFQFVAQHLADTAIIGVNSDALRSEGALTYFQPEQVPELLKRLQSGEYLIEKWTRIDTRLNGQLLNPTGGEVFLGQKERTAMSRHIIELDGVREEQKGSGLIVSTGAGSSGWYNSSIRYIYRRGDRFPKTSDELRFILTEPYWGRLTQLSLIHGSLAPGMELKIHSLNDAGGVLILDSLEMYPFHRGATVSLKISDRPLNVISRE